MKLFKLFNPKESSRPLVSNTSVLILVGALVLITYVAVSHKATTNDNQAKVDLTAASSSQVDTAIAYATNTQNNLDSTTWYLKCLGLVTKAYSVAGVTIASSDNPITYWNSNPNHWVEHSSPYVYNNPPRGALVFWGATQWSSEGHVGIFEGNNEVISSYAYPYHNDDKNSNDHRGVQFTLSERSASTYHYLGYIIPGEALATASTPPPTTVATSKPTTVAPATVKPSTPNDTTSSSSAAPQNSTPASTPPLTPTPSTPAPTTPAPTPSTPAPPTTYAETVGSSANTWTNYSIAAGTEGAQIPKGATVQIACKLTGFKVADGNTWWYRIASSPWNNAYYVSADPFYNNGHTSGTLLGTPFVDNAVPNC